MPDENDQNQSSSQSQQSTSEPEFDETPPEVELVLNSEDPDKETRRIITETKKR